MATVTGAEPSTEVTCFSDWDATQMCANAQHDQPLRLLDPIRIWLRVTEAFPFDAFRFLYFVLGSVSDEDGLAAPFDNHLRQF